MGYGLQSILLGSQEDMDPADSSMVHRNRYIYIYTYVESYARV